MSRAMQRLLQLRHKLRRQAEVQVRATQADVLATEAAQRQMQENALQQDGTQPASALQQLEYLSGELRRNAETLRERLATERARLRDAARDHKQIETLVHNETKRQQEKAALQQARLLETWVRRRGKPEEGT